MVAISTGLSTRKTTCRVCKGGNLQLVLSLGATPPANAFLKQEQLHAPEPSFPLELQFCDDCGFVQLADVVSPELLFRDYVYVSSTSPSFVAHFKELAEHVSAKLGLTDGSLVVDVGSNDGILLRPFKERGMSVLGVDPAVKIATLATQNGIETIPEFFGPAVAADIVKEHGQATLVTATSVFPHVDDLDNLVAGVKALLADDGTFLIEAYYLGDLLAKNLFDTIYHEHVSYFTVRTAMRLFERLGMQVYDVEHTDTHGGSLRLFVQKRGGSHAVNTDTINAFLQKEAEQGLDKAATYAGFATDIESNKQALLALLRDLKANGKRIVGYGAPAKGNTLLNYFRIGPDVLDYIVDDSPWKQGLYTPGMRIPVASSAMLAESPPDHILLLAWNFAEPIMRKVTDFSQFIVPVPVPRAVNSVVEEDLKIIADGLKDEAPRLEGKTVLITGGSGFLGSYMIATFEYLNRHVLRTPCKVISVDNNLVGSKRNLIKDVKDEHITFVKHDVRTPLKIDGDVDYIISAAGVASPVYYKKYPIETIEGTIFGVKNMMELAREKNAKSILFFSSSEIYGDPDPNFIPTPEHYKGNVSCTGPRSCYDESKRLGETLCMAYHQVHKVPVKIVRPFNVFGPGMRGTDYRVVPTFLSQGIGGKPLTVHDQGNQTRTFCYVADATIGFLKVLLSDRDGEIYNIGNDIEEINMRALAEKVADDVFKGTIKVNLIRYPDNYPQDEPRRRCPDLTKIKTHLGYQPRFDLATGLQRSMAWLRAHHE